MMSGRRDGSTQMSATLDEQLADLRRTNAGLQQRLDEALAREAAATEIVQANAKRHELVAHAVAEGIYDWDIDTNALWVSPRLIEIFGLTGESLSAADWNERVHPGDFEQYRSCLRDCFRGVTARLDCEYRVRHGSGQYRWIEDRGVPMPDATGKATRMVGAISDITERKEMNRIKEALLGDLNAVIDTIDYGVLFMGPDLRGRVINRAFRLMWGIPDEFIATGPTMADLTNYNRHNGIYDVPEAEFDAFIARRVKSIQEGDVVPIEMRRADGKILRYQGIVLPDGGRLLTYLDITETKRQEAELREILEYQTATSDVLKVISRSTFDLQSVLETLAETAARLCDAEMVLILRREGDVYRGTAGFGFSQEFIEYHNANPITPGRGTLTGRVALEGRPVHIIDSAADPEYTLTHAVAEGNIRTQFGVPLMREGSQIGTMNLSRQRVEPFTERQIEIVNTFADQAVIAMENARLLGELHERTHDLEESLEYQTATSDVLSVISRSTFHLQPVLDTIVETATHLCEADAAAIAMLDVERCRYVSSYALDHEYYALLQQQTITPGRDTIAGRVLLEGRVVHVADIAVDSDYAYPEALTVGKIRTMLGVPLLREGAVVGAIVLPRQRVEPFTERQIELVRTFADQAVIAIENTRLISETREALEQQTAT